MKQFIKINILTLLLLCNVYALDFSVAANHPVGNGPYSVTSADFNGDGSVDLAASNRDDNTCTILINDGFGDYPSSSTYAVGALPYQILSADLDNDGDMDIVTSNMNGNSISVMINNGAAQLEASIEYGVGMSPRGMAVADLNNDGYLDLAVTNRESNNVSILLNDDSGSFLSAVNYIVGMFPYSVSAADIDLDGDIDLAIANRSNNSVSILLNDGLANYESGAEYSVGLSPYSIILSDFNDDNYPDIAVANTSSDNISILINNGAGGFESSAEIAVGDGPISIIAIDIDNDNNCDLATSNSNSNDVTILLNDGNGIFSFENNYNVHLSPYSLTFSDYDSDGDIDLATANSSSNDISVLFNESNLSQGLVAYYPFNGNANDESGNGHNGLSNGGVDFSGENRFGVPNSSAYFDGIDDWIDIGPDVGNAVRSISLWFKSGTDINSSLPLGKQFLVRDTGSGAGEFAMGFVSQDGSPPPDRVGKINFVRRIGSALYYAETDNNFWIQNEWHHLVGVIDSIEGMSLYVDNVKQIETNESTDPTDVRSEHTILGRHGLLDERYYEGWLDDIRFYSQALTSDDIQNLYREDGIMLEVGTTSTSNLASILVPISLTFQPDQSYRAAELNFSGVTDGVEFVGIDTIGTMIGGLDWTWEENEIEGVLQTAFAGSDEINGDGIFCYLEYLVIGEACSIIPVNCDYALFNDVEVSDITNGSVYIEPTPAFGDVDENDYIQALDASDILMYLVDSLDLECQSWANANVYLDSIVDAMDASIILQLVVDSIDSLPVMPEEPMFLAAGSLELMETGAVVGQTLSIPIELTGGANIYSFQGAFDYDPSKLSFEEINVEYSGFSLMTADDGNGHVKFAAYRAHDQGPASGIFAYLEFTEVQLGSGESTDISIRSFKLNSNLNLDIPSLSIVSTNQALELPRQFTLLQNYPNPFNPSTTISYGLPVYSDVSIIIYDVMGREVTNLTRGSQTAGWHYVNWNGTNSANVQVSTGVYFAHLKSNEYSEVIKMLYLR